jgi:hypothetical protein
MDLLQKKRLFVSLGYAKNISASSSRIFLKFRKKTYSCGHCPVVKISGRIVGWGCAESKKALKFERPDLFPVGAKISDTSALSLALE